MELLISIVIYGSVSVRPLLRIVWVLLCRLTQFETGERLGLSAAALNRVPEAFPGKGYSTPTPSSWSVYCDIRRAELLPHIL